MKHFAFFLCLLFSVFSLSAQYQIDYWENNNKRSEGNLIDGKKDSVWIFYHSNGKKWMEGLYKNDQR